MNITTSTTKVSERFFNDTKWDALAGQLAHESYSLRKDATWIEEYRNCCNPNDPYVLSLDQAPFSPSYLMRGGWIDLIRQGNGRFFVTIAFRDEYSDQQVMRALKLLIKAVNKSIWGRRYGREPDFFIRGFAAAEPHVISPTQRGYLHFHLLLDDQSIVRDATYLKEVLLNEIRHVKSGKTQMIVPGSVDVREAWNMTGLAVYMTKCFYTRQWGNGSNLFFIHQNGPLGIVLPSSRNIMDY
jgi:hypothetical protein